MERPALQDITPLLSNGGTQQRVLRYLAVVQGVAWEAPVEQKKTVRSDTVQTLIRAHQGRFTGHPYAPVSVRREMQAPHQQYSQLVRQARR
jgi:hypothetical protein